MSTDGQLRIDILMVNLGQYIDMGKISTINIINPGEACDSW